MACYNFRLNCCFCENVTRCKKRWHVAKISIIFIIDNWNETVNHYVFVSCLETAFWTHWKTFFRMWTSIIPLQATNMLFSKCIHWLIFFLNLRNLTVKRNYDLLTFDGTSLQNSALKAWWMLEKRQKDKRYSFPHIIAHNLTLS